jgi:class 3 adenylate cyclase
MQALVAGEAHMARLQQKALAKPDEVRPVTHGRIEIYELDDMVAGRMVFEPGWRWSSDVKPIAGTPSCQYHHFGVVLSGVLHVQMDDGVSLEIGPSSLFEIPPGHDAWVVGDDPWVTIDFAGMRSFARPLEARAERVLASLLFTDIVDSTATAVRLGDAAWRELLAQHNETTRFAFDYYRGREMETTGDGFLAIFDSAGRAVEAAAMISQRAADLGVEVRAGVHTGEVQVDPGNVRGVAVHAAARIMAAAGPREVLVSATTRDLLAGSSLRFEPRGRHEMKGLPEPIELYALIFTSAPQRHGVPPTDISRGTPERLESPP